MNAITPVCLRGSLPPLAWPAALDTRIEAVHALHDSAPWTGRHPDRVDEAKQAVATMFGDAQGWRLSTAGYPRRLFGHRLVSGNTAFVTEAYRTLRHASFYTAKRRIVAAVTHLYNPQELRLPHDIAVDCISSWYSPLTVAFCLRFDPSGTGDAGLTDHLEAEPNATPLVLSLSGI